jgi:Ca2+-binding RTX toxin-like protein
LAKDINGSHYTNDIIYAKEGNDIINANGGDDTLYGGSGDDRLYGHQGNDTLVGGTGADILNGGYGNDSFNFLSLEDSSINVTDTIEDFEQGSDKINLSQIEESLSFESFEFVVENGHTIIKDKNSDFAIDLDNQFNMSKDDFIF